MCTGAEIAAVASAATETAAVGGGAAATAAGAGAAGGAGALGAASAGSIGALGSGAAALESGGLGALLASGGAEAAGAEAAAAAAGSAAAESGAAGATMAAADVAPTTLAAAESAPATISAANSAPTTLSAAESAAATPGMSVPASASPSLSQALGAQSGQSLNPALFNGTVTSPLAEAPSTFLGMTPTQWTQQLVTQGGAAGLQTLGAMQSQSAQRDVASSHNQALSDWEKSQLEAVDEGMSGYTPEAIAANRQKYKDQMVAEYDANTPLRDSFGTTLLASTPDEIKADYAAKQSDSNTYARNQYLKSLDLTSVGRALTSGAQQLQDALARASMNKGVISSYMSGLSGSMANASGSGSVASGLGNLTSSLGNALLASQKSSGTIK